MLKELKTIEKGLSLQLITPNDADSLIQSVEFHNRINNILEWAHYYCPDKFNRPFCKLLHNYLIEIRHEWQTATLAPRGYAKTTIICFLLPLFQALNEPDLYFHYLNIQSTSSKAISINLSIRDEIENNDRIRRDYGDQVGNQKWTEKQFVLGNGIIFSCIGVGDSVRGIHYKNIRPDWVVGDDIYDEDDSYSIDRIRKKERWFWGSIYKALAKKQTCLHLLGTAIHRADLLHKLPKNPDWKCRKFKAVMDQIKKKVLWPEVETFEKLMKDKVNMGSILFNREMQNDCRSDEESIIKEQHLKYFHTIPDDEEIIQTILAIDPAIGEKNTNDFTGKVIVYKTKFHNYYVMKIFQDRMSFNKNLEHIKKLHKDHNFKIVKLEAIAAFKAFAQELRRTTGIPLQEIKTVKDKESRLANVSPKFENGKVYISMGIETRLREDLVEQLLNNKPVHDDIRDALVLALEDNTREFYANFI